MLEMFGTAGNTKGYRPGAKGDIFVKILGNVRNNGQYYSPGSINVVHDNDLQIIFLRYYPVYPSSI